MRIWTSALSTALCLSSGLSLAREPVPTAIFPFGLINTSPAATRPDENARIILLNSQLRDALVHSGCCAPVDLSSVAARAKDLDMAFCNGCEADLAREVGADISVTGWVQKVSELILNINVVVRRIKTGDSVVTGNGTAGNGTAGSIAAGSVDIRGNTDESWSRGLAYLVRNRLHPSDW
jgi:hypothetical protein